MNGIIRVFGPDGLGRSTLAEQLAAAPQLGKSVELLRFEDEASSRAQFVADSYREIGGKALDRVVILDKDPLVERVVNHHIEVRGVQQRGLLRANPSTLRQLRLLTTATEGAIPGDVPILNLHLGLDSGGDTVERQAAVLQERIERLGRKESDPDLRGSVLQLEAVRLIADFFRISRQAILNISVPDDARPMPLVTAVRAADALRREALLISRSGSKI